MEIVEDAAPAVRGAAATRSRLVEAASRRFATDGYRGTTVRSIADDARVNVALINRYFGSKEGLFEACVSRTATELDPTAAEEGVPTAEEIIERLIARVVTPGDTVAPLEMLLLLRSSGDDEAEAISRRTLEYFTETLARAAGWDEDNPATSETLIRAQIVLAAAAGLVMLRSSNKAEPAASATAEELAAPLRAFFTTLLE